METNGDSITTEKKEELLKKIFWELNVSGKELYQILTGEREGFISLNREKIFIRMLERLGWYEIIDIIGIEKTKQMFSRETISKLRHSDLKEKYEFIRKVLSGETISFTGWGDQYYQEIKHTLFSHR